MNVAVGSTNPVKVAAVEAVASAVFPDAAVDACDVSSGVSEMPTSWEEGVTGAATRAENCMDAGGYDMAFGLEGYTADRDKGMYLSNWCVALDADGTRGDGGGITVRLPDAVAERIRDGAELGPVMDETLDREGVKEQEGTIGVLTDSTVTRKEAFEHAVRCSLSPFLRPTLHRGEER